MVAGYCVTPPDPACALCQVQDSFRGASISVRRFSVLPGKLQRCTTVNLTRGRAVPLREERKCRAPDVESMLPAFGRQREIVREPPLPPCLPCTESLSTGGAQLVAVRPQLQDSHTQPCIQAPPDHERRKHIDMCHAAS